MRIKEYRAGAARPGRVVAARDATVAKAHRSVRLVPARISADYTVRLPAPPTQVDLRCSSQEPPFNDSPQKNVGTEWVPTRNGPRTHTPARFMLLLTRTLTSTRRFSARPLFVSFEPFGCDIPIAPGATTSRTGTLHSWIR